MIDDNSRNATTLTLELPPSLGERLSRATGLLRSPHEIALEALEAWLDRNEQEIGPKPGSTADESDGDPPDTEPKAGLGPHPQAVEFQIERLYDEIIALAQNGSTEASTIERAYTQLLKLQTAEAQQYRERFEASLNMPIDAGEQILARARALREELEDLASSDAAVQDTDKP